LAEEAGYFGRQVEYRRFSIGDFGLPSEETMKSILDTIDAALEAGKKIYVHCWGGVGRTGTVVGCYLVRHGMNGQQALIQLSQWWQKVPKSRVHTRSPETDRQAEFVRNWQG
jgi:protein-tyrosine phosphatase